MVTPAAQLQIDEAVSYYVEHASKKIALKFLLDYKKAVAEILKVRYFQIFFLNFRGRKMTKLPYLIFYTIDDEQLVIVIKAVFHTSQDPDKYAVK